MNKNIVNTKFLVSTALIAAIYVVMTLAIAPLSFGMIQIRISEVLMLMAFIDKKYAPGLVLGCFIANCFSPFGMMDVVFGHSLHSGFSCGDYEMQQNTVRRKPLACALQCIHRH